MTYGLPMMGSKSKIAEELLAVLPPAHNFVDLCFGGGALTHCAMLSGKYKHFIVNDITRYGIELFCDALDGKYANETRWISREEFFALKEQDPYIRICWSFGCDQRTYLYSREIEDYKRCFHLAVVNGDYAPMLERYGLDFSELDVMGGDLKQRRINTKRIMDRYFKEGVLEKKGSHYILRDRGGISSSQRVNTDKIQSEYRQLGGGQTYSPQALSMLESMQRTERIAGVATNPTAGVSVAAGNLTRAAHLERTDRMNTFSTPSVNSGESNANLERHARLVEIGNTPSSIIERHLGDYSEVEIPEDSVVICDIPYIGTEKYQTDTGELQIFDHERYYNWVRNHDRLIFTCEYWMPDDFVCVWKRERVSTLCATNNSLRKIEKLFVHRSKLDMYRPPQPMLFGFDEV